MKPWQMIAVGVLCGLIASGILFVVATQPRGIPIRLIPPPTQAFPIVHVTGEVAHPGLFQLAPGSRVQDAINSAGGFTSIADQQALNLAAPIQDGIRIWVPSTAQSAGSLTGKRSSGPSIPTVNPITPNNPININTAAVQDLEMLPEIGPQKAQDIVSYRQKNGLFTSISQIQDVPRFGPGIFEKIKELIIVGSDG